MKTSQVTSFRDYSSCRRTSRRPKEFGAGRIDMIYLPQKGVPNHIFERSQKSNDVSTTLPFFVSLNCQMSHRIQPHNSWVKLVLFSGRSTSDVICSRAVFKHVTRNDVTRSYVNHVTGLWRNVRNDPLSLNNAIVCRVVNTVSNLTAHPIPKLRWSNYIGLGALMAFWSCSWLMFIYWFIQRQLYTCFL